MADSVIAYLARTEAFGKIMEALPGAGAAAYAVCEGEKAALAAAIAQVTGRQVIYVAPSEREASRVAGDIAQLLAQGAAVLPPRERQFARVAASREGEWQRLTALTRMRRGEARVLCCAADALLWRLTPPDVYDAWTLTLHVGDQIAPQALIDRLTGAGYERVDMVEGKGQCALRGAIVDVFPPCENDALRIEFFDEEIDGMRAFDCVSQRSVGHLQTARVAPAGEYLLPPQERPLAGARMRFLVENAMKRQGESLPQRYLAQLPSDVPGDAAQDAPDPAPADINENGIDPAGLLPAPSREGLRRLLREAEALEGGALSRQIDLWAGIALPETCALCDWFPDAIVLADTPDRCRARMDDALQGYLNELSLAVERLEAVREQDTLLLAPEDALARVNAMPLVTVQEFLRGMAGFKQGTPVHMQSLNAPQYHSAVRDLAGDINQWRSENAAVFLLCGGEARLERLRETLASLGAQLNGVVLSPETLSRGFTCARDGLYVISDADLYGAGYKKAKAQHTAGERIQAFTDLKEGDCVVHEMHGVGVYQGVVRIQTEGTWRDYLLIQYKGSDKLYVPTDQFDRVQKYIGASGEAPALNSLSGGEWQKAKSRVKAGLKKLAFDLVKLYAAREATPGHHYPPDSAWTKQFEEQFPYELTADQKRAVQDIMRDMESDKNMDRLLCGDVGYGKTEVAMRAAFKAVNDGKQVALLAPTTILAQQHFYTCLKRFADFPVNIEVLSRFRSAKAQRETLEKLAQGKVDLLIGTHRLLSKDVIFKDLGLLIVDEEQRFGVSHKESIKNLKKTVDVLTLSATPIPRTLHMSMVGVRDMSTLETPPEERVPVQTYVMDYSEGVIRDAIMRELAREGQVYFLYNRVANIEAFAGRLKQLVPEARVCIGHGQMREHALEDVMLDFYAGKYDVLLCSTIIENGLDVPRANTLIVYDADHFGLSQLYQLRGRVGRSSRVAYAYFTVRPDKMLSETAEKRLSAIREFTEFGAGFRIAMRDLEIRGAGDIFGSEQSGHIAQVGYDMYCKLIEEAVREARGDAPEKDELEPRVELRVNAFLPDTYVRGGAQRVEVYKRISMLRSMDDRADIIDELIDRFGEPPEPVMTLLDVAALRALCVYFGVSLAQRQPSGLLLRFDMRYLPDMNGLNAALPMDGSLRFASARVPGLFIPLDARVDDGGALKAAVALLSAARGRMEQAGVQ